MTLIAGLNSGAGRQGAARALKKVKAVAIALGIAVALAVPLLTANNFYIHILILAYYYTIYAVSFGLILRTGQLSLGHAAFAGIGGYCSALLALKFSIPPAIGILAGAVVAAITAWGLGAVILRLRGVYFILVTFLFGEIFNLVTIDAKDFTGGANGLIGLPAVRIADFTFRSPPTFYYLMFGGAVFTVLFVYLLMRSPVGRALESIEENVVLAESIGINTRRTQVLSFALGSGLAGFGGGLLVYYTQFASPDYFTIWESINALVILVVGGRASIAGWLLGVAFLTPLPELLRDAQAWQHVAYGVILIVVMMFFPGGIVSLKDRLFPSSERSS